MSVKMKGAEFKEYHHDDTYWVKDAWHDDHAIKVNGEYIDDITDDMPDDAEVVIESGVVFIPVQSESGMKEKDVSFVSHFKAWRKQKTCITLIITVEKEHLDAVKVAIKSQQGVVLLNEIKWGNVMTNQINRAGVDNLDRRFNPTDVLMSQIELYREFVEHMLTKPEGEADNNPEEGNNDD
ncbi:hypothetical protein [Dickeya phage JA15]|uniref:Uncharacterized protein n=3 Tax=Limestonevirus limestone TaxID=1091052 RepID=A0A2H4PHE9_9CAUD|nr:hypothetical protein [Dickeya phage JA15]ATW62111.1 hypothetical protein [Dickeya phage PP35]AYN55689.1 hypothetical protein [Dickeya phage Kamild]